MNPRTNFLKRGHFVSVYLSSHSSKHIDDFQSDKESIIICNIRAGGVGISLHGSLTAKTRLALICPTDSAQDLKQALGRVHRAQGAKSLQRIVFAADTIEEDVCNNVQAKLKRMSLINNGIDSLMDNDLQFHTRNN